MKVTVLREDNLVSLDGMFVKIDLSKLSEDIRAIYYDSAGKSVIEKQDGTNVELKNINDYKWILDDYYTRRKEVKAEAKATEREMKVTPVPQVVPDESVKLEEERKERIKQQIQSNNKVLNSIPAVAQRLEMIEKFLGIRD